ncbi:unnamed protein product [Didymodactylos carnosus]|uniref:G-protein coupled receptors family 1 profile domain-containing protein n=1 Tax=Didymodactylos carnosus TaxID=1234261 RepID=A0A816BFL6_9BILA|nr:unnamed protein product [Didymodactylos carnosus]CAF1610761.1 unnamed protein product [Didymodactylos carnosus]CAF4352773.1 unnamed protein product [Didymodactylos carnosus]CAF4493653.1 unnamed protein product [Didymodactylos carnosus]
MAICSYLIPNSMIIFIYFKLVGYVRQAGKRATPANILSRAQRQLKMLRRTVILVSILLTFGLPYFLFILMSFFINIYKYHFRISYLFATVALPLMMIALLQFTDPLKASLNKLINKRPNMIMAAVA